MKLVFSTKNVSRASFLDLCRYAYDYGYTGFEIYDAIKNSNKEIYTVEDSGHAAILGSHPKEYEKNVIEFIKSAMKK